MQIYMEATEEALFFDDFRLSKDSRQNFINI